jgi:hypothetical protein
MQGIEKFRDYNIELRMKMMSKAGAQFPLRRKALGRLKKLFAKCVTEVPPPTVHVQGGAAPPKQVQRKNSLWTRPPSLPLHVQARLHWQVQVVLRRLFWRCWSMITAVTMMMPLTISW